MKQIEIKSPIQQINNNLWVKREDLIPFSFGGNKARKAFLFFEEFKKGSYDCVLTYGSSSSNHCRVIANLCAAKNIPCYIVSPAEKYVETFNSILINIFGAKVIVVPVEKVHDTINDTINALCNDGKKPFFIQGGGHGNIGTQAYVDCYNEIVEWESENKIHFDYIFFASGTGTTQAGLICGQIMNNDQRKIIGISIARNTSRGKSIISDSIKEYLCCHGIYQKDFEEKIIFIDDYIGNGYSDKTKKVDEVIKQVMISYGLPLDETYTGKAFCGMKDYIEKHNIINKNILFIHTGGTPLFFNFLQNIKRI